MSYHGEAHANTTNRKQLSNSELRSHVTFNLKKIENKMKLKNRQHSWQWARHTRQYYKLLNAFKGRTLGTTLECEWRGP